MAIGVIMSALIDINEIERKATYAAFQDGLMEIFISQRFSCWCAMDHYTVKIVRLQSLQAALYFLNNLFLCVI